jgi:hypothetical protein
MGTVVEPGTTLSPPPSNREREEPPSQWREEPPSLKTVWLSWKFHSRWRSYTTFHPSMVRERERITTPHGDKAAPAWGSGRATIGRFFCLARGWFKIWDDYLYWLT